MELPAPHPDPPIDLSLRSLPIVETTGTWIRSHARGYDALYFGRSGTNRFDAPAQEYGILYVAVDVHGAFIETFGRQLGERYIADARIAARARSCDDEAAASPRRSHGARAGPARRGRTAYDRWL